MDDRTRTLLSDADRTAREQLTAAWQLHVDRIQEALAANWPQQIEHIFQQRTQTLAGQLTQAHADARVASQRELSQKLNQSVRRLRSLDEGWDAVLVDAAKGFCARALLFHLEGQTLRSTSLEDAIPLASAGAFASAVETKDTVVALRTGGEMSQPVAALLGESSNQKFYVFPLVARDRVAALLYADRDDQQVDTGALELLVTTAGAILETRKEEPKETLVQIAAPAPKHPASSWIVLSPEEQELHLRAQRFARVQVAQMRLYKSDEVKTGRTGQNLYTSLKMEIDSARDGFSRDFLSASPTMIDYVHLEMVRTLANNDATLLGSDYPGPMEEPHA